MSVYREAVNQWIDDAKHARISQVTQAQLKHAHIVLCRDKGMKSNAFRSMCAKRGFPSGHRRIDNDRWRGWEIDWKADDDLKRDLKVHLKPVPTHKEITEQVKSDFADQT